MNRMFTQVMLSVAVASVLNFSNIAAAATGNSATSRPPQTRSAPPARVAPSRPAPSVPSRPVSQPKPVPQPKPPVSRPPVTHTPVAPPVTHQPTVKPPVTHQPTPKPPVAPPAARPPQTGHTNPPATHNPVPQVNLGGGTKVTHPNGDFSVTKGTKTTTFRPDGSKIKEVKGKTTIDYHHDGSHSVAKNGVNQYTQAKPVVRNDGRTYIQRTYNVKNVTVVKNYRTYVRGGYSYHAYVPVSFDPWFYSYAYTPWRTSFSYTWGWHSDPWFYDYGYYYHPYATYLTPSAWLTDYLISSTLAAEYSNRIANQTAQLNNATAAANNAANRANSAADAAAAANAAVPYPGQTQAPQQPPVVVNVAAPVITDEIKEQIKQQVEEAIRAHEKQQPVELHQVMQNTKHIYAVTEEIDAVTVAACGGTTGAACTGIPPEGAVGCSLAGGDLIRLVETPADNAVGATMVVVTSKKDSCQRGSHVLISLHDLQEFQNGFSEKIEEGLNKMKTEVAPIQK